VKDRPIIFSGAMVRALIAGRKTQTRRALKPIAGLTLGKLLDERERDGNIVRCARDQVREPACAIGDRLWVGETLKYDWLEVAWFRPADDSYIMIGETLNHPAPTCWPTGVCSPIFMPRGLSRLTLIVTDVRVERVQEISEADAVAEGCVSSLKMFPDGGWIGECARSHYRDLWDGLNAKRGYGWAANPWVVRLTFEVRSGNIDALAVGQEVNAPGGGAAFAAEPRPA
jgi:hypothetical protein